jgi:dienelactone hydrolase
LLCPEWWGVAPYAKQRAEQLARDGYATLVIDVYGDGKSTDEVSEASAWMNAATADFPALMQRVQAGLSTLSSQPEVDAKRLAVIGFCFGGKLTLELLRAGADVKAGVTFHGFLTANSPAKKGDIKAEILVNQGEIDSMSSLADVPAFEAEMEAADVPYTIKIYPDAKHGFTNPLADERAKKFGVDLGYNKTADELSNQAMLDLFARTLA